MTMFWVWIAALSVAIFGVSVLVGMNLKSSRKHRATQAEITALKTSGAFSHRKSNQP